MLVALFPLAVLGCWAYNRAYPRLVCRAIGHDGSWVFTVMTADSITSTHQLICTRCRRTVST